MTLCSTSKRVKDEMEDMQKRYLKVIGIRTEEDLTKFRITTIEELIEKHGKLKLTKILTNSEHPITKSLEKRESVTRKNFPFTIPKCKSEKYQNSFLQQFLRKLEKEGLPTQPTLPSKPLIAQQKAKCDICMKEFKNTRGVNQHKRLIHKDQL
jgi:hypothetical protein